MSKIVTVLVREYVSTIRRFSFWMVTLGLPLLIVLMSVLSAGLSVYVMKSKQDKPRNSGESAVLGIFDPGNLVPIERLVGVVNKERSVHRDDLEQLFETISADDEIRSRMKELLEPAMPREGQAYIQQAYRFYSDQTIAEEALTNDDVGALLVLPAVIDHSWDPALILPQEDSVRPDSLRFIEKTLRRTMLGAHVSDAQWLEAMINPLENVAIRTISSPEDQADRHVQVSLREKMRQYVLPLVFIMIMMIAVFTSTERLVRGLVEEKQNRVIELLLSSITAEELMAGKVFGLGLVGLTQLSIWLLLMFAPLSITIAAVWLGSGAILLFILFFLGGYLLLAIWISAFGSLGNNYQEANQWSMIWIMLAMSPVFLLNVLLEQPEGTLAIVMSYFPLTSPFTVIARYAANAISPVEIVFSLLLLVLSIALSIRIASKIFRTGILLTGKRPTPAVVWRLLRQA